jgi:phospholipase C
VVWIVMENKSADAVVGSSSGSADPYTAALATACGLATNYHSITHPSLPNYLAATSGDTHGVASDCQPARCSQPGPSLFGQLASAHKSWRSYVESMPAACSTHNASPYAAKHNPAVYYTALGASCRRSDVPLAGSLTQDLARGPLPAFALIVPNSCDDTHSCPLPVGDAWLRTWVTRLISTRDYRAGQMVVFVTWDEGDVHSDVKGEDCSQNPTDPGCHVAMLVLSANTPAGTAASDLYTHYSLLKTTEQLLGLHTYLGHAADPSTLSMRSAFHL